MREAMANMTKQCFDGFNRKMSHPIGGPLNLLLGTNFKFGSFYPTMRDNGQRMKKKVLKYVQDRKKGVTKSKMNGADLLSVFLEDQVMFPDDMIV